MAPLIFAPKTSLQKAHLVGNIWQTIEALIAIKHLYSSPLCVHKLVKMIYCICVRRLSANALEELVKVFFQVTFDCRECVLYSYFSANDIQFLIMRGDSGLNFKAIWLIFISFLPFKRTNCEVYPSNMQKSLF